MSAKTQKIAVDLIEALDLLPTSESTLRRAIRKEVADGKFPPPLEAKRDSKGRLSISVANLTAWHDSWPDA